MRAFLMKMRRLLALAGKAENLPYTILGGLALVSLGARLLLIAR